MDRKIDKLKNLLGLDRLRIRGEERPGDRKNCPPIEEILSSFSAEAGPELKEKIIDHILKCPSCQSEFELILKSREFASQVSEVLFPIHPLRKIKEFFFWFPGRFWKFAAVFSLAAILVITIYFQISGWNIFHAERGPARTDNFMMKEVITPTSQSIKLMWAPLPEALFYIVELFDENMCLIWQSPPEKETQLELPAAIIETIESKDYFYWHFRTWTHDKTIIESPVKKVFLNQKGRQ